MTIEKLWQNLKPLLQKVDKIENDMQETKEELGEKMSQMEARFEKRTNQLEERTNQLEVKLEERTNQLEEKLEERTAQLQKQFEEKTNQLQGEINNIKEDIHEIKDVNMAQMINLQTQVIKELRETNKKLDKYINENEVEHKKFEYKIANLEWKTKITD